MQLQPPKLWLWTLASCSTEQAGAPPSLVQLQLPKLWLWTQVSLCSWGAKSRQEPCTSGTAAAAQTVAADPGISILLGAQETPSLPWQAWKYLLLMLGFSLLSVPTMILEQSQG